MKQRSEFKFQRLQNSIIRTQTAVSRLTTLLRGLFFDNVKIEQILKSAPKRTRTSDLWFRKPSLYPAELWALNSIKRLDGNLQNCFKAFFSLSMTQQRELLPTTQ